MRIGPLTPQPLILGHIQPRPATFELAGTVHPARRNALGQAALTGPALDPSPTLSPFARGPRDRYHVSSGAKGGRFSRAL